MTTSSRHDYQLRFAPIAPFPTISQTRGLAAVLARIEQKNQRRRRRRVLLKRSLAPLLTLTGTLKRALLHQHAPPFATLSSRRTMAA